MIALYGKSASAVIPPRPSAEKAIIIVPWDMREHYVGKIYSSSRQHTVTVCAGMATHEADEGNAPAMKRVRVRQDCQHCGISLGKSSFYEHIVICTHKRDSDRFLVTKIQSVKITRFQNPQSCTTQIVL